MTYLLDSNVCSEFIRGNQIVSKRFRVHYQHIAVSVVTVTELFVWGFRSKSSARWLPLIRSFLARVPVIDIDVQLAEKNRTAPGSDFGPGATATLTGFDDCGYRPRVTSDFGNA
jgi:predicted nucleic acid-binding protein